jgi:hypothetical protein
VLSKDARRDLRVLLDELVDGVLRDIGTRVGEVHESLEPRIGLPQNCVAVSWDHTS